MKRVINRQAWSWGLATGCLEADGKFRSIEAQGSSKVGLFYAKDLAMTESKG